MLYGVTLIKYAQIAKIKSIEMIIYNILIIRRGSLYSLLVSICHFNFDYNECQSLSYGIKKFKALN